MVLNELLVPWVELYNLSSSPATLSGFMLIYAVGGTFQNMVINTTVAGGGYLVINLGAFDYVEGVGLYDASSNLVDSFGSVGPNAGSSWHRCPNGRGNWRFDTDAPTMGSANICQ